MKAVTFIGKVKNGKIEFENKESFSILLGSLEGSDIEIDISRYSDRRTITQNRAIHLYFQMLADTLNDAGLDMRKVLKKDVEIEWTKDSVKNYLWRPIQEALFEKESTVELDRHKEITRVYETLNRHLGQKFGIHVPFPSIETQFAKI